MAFLTDVGVVAFFALRDGGHGGAGLLVAAAITVFNTTIRPRIIRSLEHRADHHARGHVGESAYANALLRLHELNAIPLVLRQKGTHGHPYDRAAGAVGLPEVRPSPPGIVPASIAISLAAVAIGLAATYGLRLVEPKCDADVTACTRAVVMTSGSTETLVALADARLAHDDPTATMLYRAANDSDARSRELPLHAARHLVDAGHCRDANGMIGTLDRRWPTAKNASDMIALRHDLAACYVKSVESGGVSPSVE